MIKLLTIFLMAVLACSGQGFNQLNVLPAQDNSATGELRFRELNSNGLNYVGFKAPSSITTNRIWILPSADGAAGEVWSTNGSGVLGWVSPSGLPVVDTVFLVKGSADATKRLRIEADGITTATDRIWTAPDADLTVAGQNIINTFSQNNIFSSDQTFHVGITLRSNDTVSLASIRGATTGSTNYTVRLPPAQGASGQAMVNNGSGDLSWTTIATFPVVDTTAIISGSADTSKLLRFEIDGFSASTTRVLTPQNADYTIAGTNISNTFSANQTFSANLLWGADSTYDIGQTATRPRTMYIDTVNVEKVEITQTTHSSHWDLSATSTVFDFINPSSDSVFQVSDGVPGQIRFKSVIAPWSTGTAINIGGDEGVGNPRRFNTAYLRALDIDNGSLVFSASSGAIRFGVTPTPATDNLYSLGSTGNQWVTFYFKGSIVQNTTSRIDASGNINGASIQVAGTTRINSSGNGVFASSATVGGTEVVLQSRTISTSSPLGGGGALSGNLTLTCTTCVTTDTTQTISGAKTFSSTAVFNNGIATASGTNSEIFIGNSNFYTRAFSGGDVNCSGVTNGWFGIRTDTNEIQMCSGGAMKKVALT